MLSDILLWNKVGRIVTIISEKLNIEPERALELFYESDTCERLHDGEDFLYMMGDYYIAEELLLELRHKMS